MVEKEEHVAIRKKAKKQKRGKPQRNLRGNREEVDVNADYVVIYLRDNEPNF
mgnify:CR=1 FL=1